MSIEDETPEVKKWSPWAITAAALLTLLLGVAAISVFRSYLTVDPQESAQHDKKQEAKKSDIEISRPLALPAEPKTEIQCVKPGHWVGTSQGIRANFRDFVGDLRTWVVSPQNNAYPVAQTPYILTTRRPVLLTKEHAKETDSTLLVPHTNQELQLSAQLEERGLGLKTAPSRTALTAMPSFQYHLVILAQEPSRYGYIRTLDSVKVPFDGESDADDIEDPLHYRVVSLDVSQSIALPDNPLTWTSIAYIVWDQVDPQRFTNEQQRALVDWLHWGGQLIVSGPDSLDLLKGSFLDGYLPASNAGPRTIVADDPALAELIRHWLIGKTAATRLPFRPTTPWSAIKLDIRIDAQPVANTGELFAERRVGRGRIVVSAMHLAERELVNWRSGFESLFNAVLLRRPPREYRPGHFGGLTLAWAERKLQDRRLDARLTTNTRYLARDLGVETKYRYEDVSNEYAAPMPGAEPLQAYRPPPLSPGGIGAWNDSNDTAAAARTALREAAGVEVPGAGFVILCLAAYLIVLVPINWLVFNTLGRVEWAWIAAPIIAIIGTFVIVERARLDIGFVRAHTEIGLLELQPDHPRAHLTRYTALYTSLSTIYDLEFPNMTTLAAPFPTQADFRMLRGASFQEIDFLRYDTVRLAGLPISSNTTGMVHSEQMVTLEGVIRIARSVASGNRQIENLSKFELNSVCLVRRLTPEETQRSGSRRQIEGRWVGQMLPGQSAPLALSTLDNEKAMFAAERAQEQRYLHSERLNLEPLFRLALDPRHMDEGELRLVARLDEVLSGQTITPAASQSRGAVLVVAHLQYGPLRPPRPDLNVRQDVKTADLSDDSPDFDDEFN